MRNKKLIRAIRIRQSQTGESACEARRRLMARECAYCASWTTTTCGICGGPVCGHHSTDNGDCEVHSE